MQSARVVPPVSRRIEQPKTSAPAAAEMFKSPIKSLLVGLLFLVCAPRHYTSGWAILSSVFSAYLTLSRNKLHSDPKPDKFVTPDAI